MSTINTQFIEEKLRIISLYFQRMENVLIFSDSDIKDDYLKFHTLERLVQLIVDEMVDINTHIIRYASLRAPDDFQSTFLVLAGNKILSQDLADRLAPIVGLRNRLVHRYEAVDLATLISMARKEKDDIREYVSSIGEYIKSNVGISK